VPEQQFWKESFSDTQRAEGGTGITEVGALVRRVNVKALGDLTEKLQSELASSSQEVADDDSADQPAPVPADSADAPPAAE
jgi:hypothetical protein